MGRAPIFVDELSRLAAEIADPPVTAIAERAAAPLRVAVCGRRGVGRGTVARALACAGVAVCAPGVADVADVADVVVYVVAEVVKPEDTDAVAATTRPVLVVLNKADLAGGVSCAEVSALTAARTEPMVGLLAVAALDDRLDDTLWAALRVLAAEPDEPGCIDALVAGRHRLPRPVRLRLCEALDRFGIGQAVCALRRDSPAAVVRTRLRRVSGVDAVVAAIDAVGAEVRYRRMLHAVAGLEALAVGAAGTGGRIGAFLSGDDVVFARMSAAVEVIEAAGLTVDPAEEPAAHLRRAVTWQRYSRGPVTGVHRACANDIARASLRRWSRAGGAQ
jgi:hypothetical protein